TGDDIYLNAYYGSSSGVRVKNVSLNGKDVIVNLDSGNTITLKDAKDEQIYIDGCYTDGKQVGTLAFSSSSADVATYDDVDEILSFTDAASSDVSDLDSLMTELPTENVSVDEFSSGTADDSRNLLNGVTFAQASNKK
ncbi:MAG: hypothetical protein IKP64_14965, partial [Selenomonadaceae bacterium]|nr:hypothetical protein [Selenomonadaceae bacterium]